MKKVDATNMITSTIDYFLIKASVNIRDMLLSVGIKAEFYVDNSTPVVCIGSTEYRLVVEKVYVDSESE